MSAEEVSGCATQQLSHEVLSPFHLLVCLHSLMKSSRSLEFWNSKVFCSVHTLTASLWNCLDTIIFSSGLQG